MTKADRLAKGIYWDRSLNCFTGCTPVGPACDNCWARRMAYRLRGRYGYPTDEPFRPTFHPGRLSQVNSKQRPQVIALCFMSDPFHENYWKQSIFRMLERVIDCSQHIFIALTKRPRIMRSILEGRDPPIPNLIGGVSVWDQESADRMIPILLQTNLATRIVSFEPALNSINFSKWLNIGVNNENKRANISKPVSNRELLGRSHGTDMEASAKEGREDGFLRRNIAGSSGREEHVHGLPESNVYSGSKAKDSICSQDHLDDPQSDRHSGRDGDQSQRRDKGEQSPLQSGSDDSFSEHDPQLSGTGEKNEGSGRGEKLFSKIDQRGSSANTPSMSGEGAVPRSDSRDVQCKSTSSVQYSSPQNMDNTLRLDAIILGGESGPGARPMHPDWARSVRDQCQAANVPFLFKQHGEWLHQSQFQYIEKYKWLKDTALLQASTRKLHRWPDGTFSYRIGKKAAGRLLDGREHNKLPEVVK